MADYNGINYSPGQFSSGYLYLPGRSYDISSKFNYYKMMAYDTSASTWRTWIAAGAPDMTAQQYNGVAFPFTQVFVITRF